MKKKYNLKKWLGFFACIAIIAYLLTLSKSNAVALIKTEFENLSSQYKGFVSQKNDFSLWWIGPEKLNIINDNSPGVELDINSCYEDIQSKSVYDNALKNISVNVDKILKQNGFTKNAENSSKSFTDDKFYDYVQAYEKQNYKCALTANPDCSTSDEKLPLHYAFSFSCTDKYNENYLQQKKYLQDLDIKDSIVHVDKKDGDFIKLNVNYRRSGHYILAKMVNGKWQELFAGQDDPPCTIVTKYEIPKTLTPTCYSY